MAIELNKYGKKPEYNPDEYFKKFIPLIIKNAPEYDNFWLHNLVKSFKLSKNDQLVFDDMEHDLKVKLDSIGLAKLYPNGQLCLTDKGCDKKNGTESHNIIPKYQRIYLTFFIIFGLIGSYGAYKTIFPDVSKSDYQSLKSDFEILKKKYDSIIQLNLKPIKKTLENTSPSKN